MTTWWRISRSVLIALWLIVITGTPPPAFGGNVLAVYPHFGFSHFKVVMPILNELVRRGHQLTVISYVNHPHAAEWPNYEQLLISQAGEDQSSTTINLVPLSEHTPTRSLLTLFWEYIALHSEGQESCERLYASGHVETVLKRHQTKPYDLLLTEYFNSDCQLALAKLMDLPIIGLSTCALMPYYYDRIDLPDTPSFIQSEFVGFAGVLSWDERLVNFIQAKMLKLLYKYHSIRADNALVRKHFGIDVDVDEVARTQTAFIFGNQHYSLMGSRPQSRQFIEVGGVHLTSQAEQELTPNIAQFLDQSDVPIIFISWGSMVRISSIDVDKLAAIVEALERQPLRVIWKWEADEKPKVDSTKFLFVKWAPQLALLCHPKVELFWAHGGLLGTTESVHCGKPMLVTPIYGDQFLNAFSVQNRGMGLKLDYEDIRVTRVTQALNELNNTSYATRSLGISKIFNQRQNSPLESAIWCVEHVIQHGLLAAEMLQSPGIELNWFVYHSLDSVCLIFVVLMALAYSLCHFSGGSSSKSFNGNRRRKSKRS
ncbi:UDP-glucuronosyltransferase [Drosophila miranda]|uniref:UDP-glucuronosyltransferase n=1 Tax=Drosophila miranda TaxID=7229 RepID=UPI0007E70525|nr:UDP-glucuronosyltransferase [Drosophila miranda]